MELLVFRLRQFRRGSPLTLATQMTQFYTVTRAPESHGPMAFAEPVDPRFEATPPKCPKCGAIVANPRWLPPFEVRLENPEAFRDVVSSFIGVELLTSRALAESLRRLKGVECIQAVRVSEIGKKSDCNPSPAIFDVRIVHSHVRVDFDACDVSWSSAPDEDYCRYCGPSGGGRNGCYWSVERLVLDLAQWDAEEIFYPINLAGTLVATKTAVQKADLLSFGALSVTPIEDYRYVPGPKRSA